VCLCGTGRGLVRFRYFIGVLPLKGPNKLSPAFSPVLPVRLRRPSLLLPGVSLFGLYQFGAPEMVTLKEAVVEELLDNSAMTNSEAHEWGNALTFHHQWMVLSREHAAALVQHRREIMMVSWVWAWLRAMLWGHKHTIRVMDAHSLPLFVKCTVHRGTMRASCCRSGCLLGGLGNYSATANRAGWRMDRNLQTVQCILSGDVAELCCAVMRCPSHCCCAGRWASAAQGVLQCNGWHGGLFVTRSCTAAWMVLSCDAGAIRCGVANASAVSCPCCSCRLAVCCTRRAAV
jgi:hypothetical protein